MKTSIAATLAGAIVLAGASVGAHATPFTNGDFEDTSGFTDNRGQDTDDLAAGSTSMTGWKVSATHNVAWIGPTNPFGLSAQHGSYFLDLTSYDDGAPFGGVSQAVDTVAGGHYDLTFFLGADGGGIGNTGIAASAGATTQTFTNAINAANHWESEVLSFVATGTTTLLSLQGSVGGIYIGLDHVSLACTGNCVAATPLPGSIVMLGTALLGLGFVGYRRKQA
jgi:hypothetical protein